MTVRTTPACWDWPIPDEIKDRVDGFVDDGMPVDIFADWQQDRCATCGGRLRRFVMDHDHATGLCRGLLCRPCNTKEGTRAHEPLFVAYRDRHPAAILGLTSVYVDMFGRTPRMSGVVAVTQAQRWQAMDVVSAAIARAGSSL